MNTTTYYKAFPGKRGRRDGKRIGRFMRAVERTMWFDKGKLIPNQFRRATGASYTRFGGIELLNRVRTCDFGA